MAVLTNTMMQGTAAISDEEPYNIEKSLRFDDSSEGNLKRLFQAGNSHTWTWAAWVKRSKIGVQHNLFSAYGGDANNQGYLVLESDDMIAFDQRIGGTWSNSTKTTKLFRDTNAWFHITFAFDSTQIAETDRIRLYINGEIVTEWSDAPNCTQYLSGKYNTAMYHEIGKGQGNDNYMDGYLSDVHFIDGLALSPAAFGSFDSTGNWNPKAFARPAPNNGRTWSSGVTTSDSAGWTNNNGPAQMFDGTETDGYPVNADKTITMTFNPAIEVKQGIRLQLRNGGRTHNSWSSTITGTGIRETYISGTISPYELWPLKLDHGTKLSSLTITPGSGYWAQCARLEIDGVVLVDGRTDFTTRNNPHDGTVWSSHTTANNGFHGSNPVTMGFDGNLGSNDHLLGDYTSDSTVTFDVPGDGLPFNTLRIYGGKDAALSDANSFTVNGTDITSQINTGANWHTITGVSSPLTEVTARAKQSGQVAYWHAIELDGVILTDGVGDNSFHLKFNDTSLNRYLGKDTLSGKIEDATGGLPIYKTKAGSTDAADYGDVKDTGNRTDSDSSDLKIALPLYNNLDDESGNNRDGTITGTTAAVTDQSRFYGGCYYFPGTGNTSSYISIADCAEVDFQGAWTIEYWVRFKRAPGTQDAPCASATDYKRPSMFRLTSGEMGYFSSSNGSSWNQVIGDGAATGKGKQVLAKDTWYHIAFQYDGSSKFTAYVNGILDLDYTTSATGNANNASEAYTLGRWGQVYGFQGWLQDFRIYGKVKYSSAFKPPTRNDFIPYNFDIGAKADSGVESYIAEARWTQKGAGTLTTNGTLAGGFRNVSMPDGYVSNWAAGSHVAWNTSTGSNQPIRWEPVSGIAYSSKVRLWTGGSDGGQRHFRINDGTYVNSADPDESRAVIVATGSGTITSIQAYTTYMGGNSVGWQAVEVDGNILHWEEGDPLASDVVTDTPTNYTDTSDVEHGNYCTLNPLELTYGTNTFSEGNLKCDPDTNWCASFGTMAPSTGKWYWEVLVGETNAYMGIQGGNQDNSNQNPQNNVANILYYSVNGKYKNGTTYTNYGASYAKDDYIGVALDLDSSPQTVTFYKNNSSQGAINLSVGTGIENNVIKPMFVQINDPYWVNFGQRAFKYTPPAGFKALCTQNLDDTFSGAELNNPSKYFDVATYTGNGADHDIKGIGFQPDLVWIKERNGTQSHHIQDAIRGVTYNLVSNLTSAQSQAVDTVKAFNSDGFTTGSDQATNNDGDTYVSWLWDAGTAANTSTNTDGDNITVAVGNQWVNATAGFSITKYAGDGSGGANNDSGDAVGHGLGAKPDFIIIKKIDGVNGWPVYNSALANSTDHLNLQTTGAIDAGNYCYAAQPTNTKVELGNNGEVNNTGNDYIMYCWTAIPGYSAFGKYTGNGNANGPFVYTGFKPKWLMIKKASSGTDNWRIVDTARDTYNMADAELYANTNGADNDSDLCDILSNGFKIRVSFSGSNSDNETYIYAAFAEHPFKTARAR